MSQDKEVPDQDATVRTQPEEAVDGPRLNAEMAKVSLHQPRTLHTY
jgi:hypothetical protein